MQESYNTKTNQKILPHPYLQLTSPQKHQAPTKKIHSQHQRGLRINCQTIMPNGYLTQQEFHCIQLICQGHTITKAANLLTLSPRTVEFYLNNVKKRYSIKKKSQLITLFNPLFAKSPFVKHEPDLT